MVAVTETIGLTVYKARQIDEFETAHDIGISLADRQQWVGNLSNPCVLIGAIPVEPVPRWSQTSGNDGSGHNGSARDVSGQDVSGHDA